MNKKNVAVVIRKSPHGSIYPSQGLQLAVALGEELDPVTIALKDGIYAFLHEAEKSSYRPEISLLQKNGKQILADKTSMDERGIMPDDLIKDVEIKEREEIQRIMARMDAVVTF